MQAFPEAKVVLNVRDPDKWFDSWQALWEAVDGANVPEKIVRFHDWMPMLDAMRDTYFGGRIEREQSIGVFNAHIEAVKRDVPADRLLVFSVTEGWEPLCEFLGVDIPDTPFPHLNERDGMGELLQAVLWTNEPLQL